MGCEISQTENPPIGNSAFNISACDPFLNARLQGGYILTKVKPRNRHVMVRMHVHDDFSVFVFFLISFFPPCQTNSRTAHNETDVTKRAKRAPNPGNCSDAILCLSIGLRAGSRRICNWLPSTLAELRLSATDGLKTAVTVVVCVWGGDTPWFDALSLGSNLLSPPQPSRWRRSLWFLDGAGTAIRHRKKRRSCIFFLLLPLRLLPVFRRGFVDIRGRRRAGALRCSCRTGCGEWSLQCNLHGAVSRRCRLVGGGAVRGAEGRHFLRVEERKLRT